MVRLDLWKCLLKKESFELGFEIEVREEEGEIPQAGRQQIPDSWGNKAMVANRFEITFRVVGQV